VARWSCGPRKDTRLALEALSRAVGARQPGSVVFHTDRGSEYAAGIIQQRTAQLGFTQSMSRPGKVTDKPASSRSSIR
jgi:transposase InsO family protein